MLSKIRRHCSSFSSWIHRSLEGSRYEAGVMATMMTRYRHLITTYDEERAYLRTNVCRFWFAVRWPDSTSGCGVWMRIRRAGG